MADLEETVARHTAALQAALLALQKYMDGTGTLTHALSGEESILRCGEKRRVHYIELSDGSGAEMRVEVFRL